MVEFSILNSVVGIIVIGINNLSKNLFNMQASKGNIETLRLKHLRNFGEHKLSLTQLSDSSKIW